jgi:hypothetical protein
VNSKQRLFGIIWVALVGFAVGLGISETSEPLAPGIYLLIEVNGEKLPAVSWTKKSNGERCKTETLGGALLLDSKGQWASLVTERDVCVHEDDSETAGEKASTMFAGSYKISGNQITLQDETSADQAILKGDLLVLTIVGVGVFEGQTTEYVLRRD